MDATNINFDDFFKNSKPTYSLTDEVIVFDREILTSKHILNPETMPPVRLKTLTFILCRYGKMTFSVNYKTFHLSKGSLIMLNRHNVVDNIKIDNNCELLALVISRDIAISCIRYTPLIKKILTTTTTTKSHYRPERILQLEDDEMRNIVDIIVRIQKYLKLTNHAFQSQIVRNETNNFILEFANIFLQRSGTDTKKGEKESRKDEISSEFAKLLVKHFREQHEVSFYANKLGMTPVNLSRSVVTTSGKSPIQWISGVLLTEAKILLRKPDATVKQVANELNFGDQSSFGKFFRKHTGMTPVEYRNGGKKHRKVS
jgi:AraC-like DNA-binding protein